MRNSLWYIAVHFLFWPQIFGLLGLCAHFHTGGQISSFNDSVGCLLPTGYKAILKSRLRIGMLSLPAAICLQSQIR